MLAHNQFFKKKKKSNCFHLIPNFFVFILFSSHFLPILFFSIDCVLSSLYLFHFFKFSLSFSSLICIFYWASFLIVELNIYSSSSTYFLGYYLHYMAIENCFVTKNLVGLKNSHFNRLLITWNILNNKFSTLV